MCKRICVRQALCVAGMCVCVCFCVSGAWASSTLLGAKGLITAPDARSYESGTAWTGAGYSDPYVHGFVGAQISDALGIVIRQSAEVSDPGEDPRNFYPGIDAKLRLSKETRAAPQTAVGWQSASGHKRMGGEYFVASKRFYNWDFTTGIGWGRYAQGLTLDNPLKLIGSHFNQRRNIDGNMPVQPYHWFTGNKVGLFAGAQYQTPWQGLSLKFDVGADQYAAERAAFSYSAPSPWAAGVNYALPLGQAVQMDTQLAVHGGDKISLRVAFSSLMDKWMAQPAPARHVPLKPNRPTQTASSGSIETEAARDNVILDHTRIDQQSKTAFAQMTLNPHYSMPSQLGRALVHMGNTIGNKIEKFTLQSGFLGLTGPKISVMRGDIERAYHHQGSAAEIWQNAEIEDVKNQPWSWKKRPRFHDRKAEFMPFKLTLEHQNSLSEEDYLAITRTSAIAKVFLPRKHGYFDYGIAARLNLHDNLRQIRKYRTRAFYPVRSDVDEFAQDLIGLDEAYIAFTHSFRPDIHIAAMNGYLEEMYAGAGGQILYRPLDSRFAVGAEAFLALKRDPHSTMHTQLTGDNVLTAQVTGYYDWPHEDITLEATLGRFLGADTGVRVGFEKQFKNGVKLSGHMSLSDTADPDIYGGATHVDHGLRLTMPLGGIKHVPDYIYADVRSQPFGRDIAQSLHKPLDLYEITQPWSMPSITRNWDDIVQH